MIFEKNIIIKHGEYNEKNIIIYIMYWINRMFWSKNTTITIQPWQQNGLFNNEFTVKAGESIRLVMDNTATIEAKHNIVVLNDASKITEVGTQALTEADYIPDNPAIIAATPMADAGAQSEVTFTAPSTPGEYVFICTYPGHYMMMKGKMIVQ